MLIKKFKLDQPETVFFVVMVVSVGFLVYPLWNYTQFYLALWNFGCAVSNLTIDINQITNIQIAIEFLIMNPTDYSGLGLTSINCGLEYIDGMHLVFDPTLAGHWGGNWRPSNVWELKAQYISYKRPIAAHANDTVALTSIINPHAGNTFEQNNAWSFIGFLETQPDLIEWKLNCCFIISSFLGSFEVWRYLSYVTPMTYQ